MALRFGTDGIRGVAGRELTAEAAVALGRAAGRILGSDGGRFLIGRDTRRSGPMLQAALAAGVASAGVDVTDLGVMPTPAVAAMAAAYGQPAAMVSASHNPFGDNGVKFFAAGGTKLPSEVQAEMESELNGLLEDRQGDRGSPVTGAAIGTITSEPNALDWYEARLVAALEGRRLERIGVVVDCANGAASGTAADVLTAAGAEVLGTLGCTPDGSNINEGCGSTDPSGLARAVVDLGADIGLAFDGDADRVIAVDATGQVVDGDQMLAIFAEDFRDRERLADDTVVVTVMTNLGFHQAMAARGISVHQTPVGDRHVLEALDRHGWTLGGEQSGHLVFRDLATTGDGILCGLLLTDVMARTGRPLADLAGAGMQRLPQVLRNVEVAHPDRLDATASVWSEVEAVEAQLGARGRVVLRRSGTERVIRVMAEAPTESEAADVVGRVSAAVVSALG